MENDPIEARFSSKASNVQQLPKTYTEAQLEGARSALRAKIAQEMDLSELLHEAELLIDAAAGIFAEATGKTLNASDWADWWKARMKYASMKESRSPARRARLAMKAESQGAPRVQIEEVLIKASDDNLESALQALVDEARR